MPPAETVRSSAPPPDPIDPDRRVRLLAAATACYPLLFRELAESDLLEAVCARLVEHGVARLAWAGLADSRPGRLIRPLAQRGFEPGFLPSLHIAPNGASPAASAFRTGTPAVYRRIQSDPDAESWRHEAARRGFDAAVCLPLPGPDRPVGLLALFAAESDAFGSGELAPLQDLAGALGHTLAARGAARETEGQTEQGRLPETVLETLDQAVALLDAAGMILYANPAFARACGVTEADRLRGRPLPALAEQTEPVHRLVRQAAESGHAAGAFRPRPPDAAPTGDTAIRLSAIRDELGRTIRLLAQLGSGDDPETGKNWTALARERAELERKLEQASTELKSARAETEMAGRTKSDFLAGMSHELRTPLNAVIGFAEVLLEPHFGALAPKQAEYLTHILESGLHLQGLIDDILTLSRFETGGMLLQSQPLALRALLDESLAPFGERCEGQGLSLRLLVQEAASGLTLRGDPARLRQILAHLLDNALKFTPEGGQILVTARLLENADTARENPAFPPPYSLPRIPDRAPPVAFPAVEVVVADTGIGIKPEQAEAVFAEFYQIRKSPLRKPAGTGLGLALCRRFVRLHGGHIWIESAGEGHGIRAVTLLPLNPPTQD